MQGGEVMAKGFDGWIKDGLASVSFGKSGGMCADARANAYEAVDFCPCQGLGDRGIEASFFAAAFEEVGEDHGAPHMLLLGSQKIECDGQGIQVGAIAVVDDGAVVDAVF
jgi:hypothetical protein